MENKPVLTMAGEAYELLKKETNGFKHAICNRPKKIIEQYKLNIFMTYNAFFYDNIPAPVIAADTDEITLPCGESFRIPHIAHNKIISILKDNVAIIRFHNKASNETMSITQIIKT